MEGNRRPARKTQMLVKVKTAKSPAMTQTSHGRSLPGPSRRAPGRRGPAPFLVDAMHTSRTRAVRNSTRQILMRAGYKRFAVPLRPLGCSNFSAGNRIFCGTPGCFSGGRMWGCGVL